MYLDDLDRAVFATERTFYDWAMAHIRKDGYSSEDVLAYAARYVVEHGLDLPLSFGSYAGALSFSGSVSSMLESDGSFDIYPFISELGLVGRAITYITDARVRYGAVKNIRNYVDVFTYYDVGAYSYLGLVAFPGARAALGVVQEMPLDVSGKLCVINVLGNGGYVVLPSRSEMFKTSNQFNQVRVWLGIVRNYLEQVNIGDEAIVLVSESEFGRNDAMVRELKTHLRRYYDVKYVIQDGVRALYIKKVKLFEDVEQNEDHLNWLLFNKNL